MSDALIKTDKQLTGSVSADSLVVHREELAELEARLRSVSERARKLLVHIAELAYCKSRPPLPRGVPESKPQRKPDVAYLPELYESCGLGVEEMYPLLEELRAARIVEIEDQYPFEDVKVSSLTSGWNAIFAISLFSQQENLSLRDILVELYFDFLK